MTIEHMASLPVHLEEGADISYEEIRFHIYGSIDISWSAL